MPSKKQKTLHAPPVPVPREMIKNPVFAARCKTGVREVMVGDQTWHIGIARPIIKNQHIATIGQDYISQSLSVAHGRLCFTLLSLWRDNDCSRSLNVSLGDLTRAYYNGSARASWYYGRVLKLLFDLRDTWVKISHPNGKEEFFAIVGDVKLVKQPDQSIMLERVDLSPEFMGFMSKLENVAYLRLDVFNAIASPIAASIYTYIPSRAYHHTKEDPFQITLKNLLQQIDLDVPPNKSARKKIFTQHAETKQGSVIQQLDGAKLTSGTLRVAIEETADKKDYKLLAWVEANCESSIVWGSGVLHDKWCSSGGTELGYYACMANKQPLNEYELELLKICSIDIESIRNALEQSRALIGEEKFQEELADIKADCLEGRAPKTSFQRKLLNRLVIAVERVEKF